MPREPRMKIECDHTKSGKICSCDASFNIHCPSCDTKPMKQDDFTIDLSFNDGLMVGNSIIYQIGHDSTGAPIIKMKGTADKHVFEEECGQRECHNDEPHSSDIHIGSEGPASERNALIDELIQEVESMLKKNEKFSDDFALGKDEVFIKIADLLKSKKK